MMQEWLKDDARTDILLLELTSKMALHEGGLTHATIADKDELESRNLTLHADAIDAMCCGEGESVSAGE
jgi:hypothetical protein